MKSKKIEKFDLDEFNKDRPKKSVKKTTRFTVLLIPDSTDHSRSFELTFDHLMRIAAVIVAICLILVSLLISSGMKNYRLAHDDSDKKVIEDLNKQIEELNEEKQEMYDQIVYLSNLVAEKQEREETISAEKAEQALPTGYPIEGSAFMVDGSSVSDIEMVKGRVIFNTIIGTAVVCSADGVVVGISGDDIFGNSVTVDHGNGYQSIYRCNGSVKVAEGDPVSRSEVLYVITQEDSLFAYEILKDGVAVEPLDFMDLNG